MKFVNAGSSGQWGWHATELAMKCPQAFAYNYRVDWGTAGKPNTGEKPALIKGSLVHQGMAHFYLRLRDERDGIEETDWADPDDAIDDCAEKLGPGAEKYVQTAKETVRAYAAHFCNESWMPLDVEEVFTADIGGWKFTQRLDLVVRDAAGKVLIVDHKTTGMLSPETAQRYALSGQFLGMAQFGNLIWGSEFGGVWLNLIELPDSRTNKKPRFLRQPIAPSPHALRLFPLTVHHARERVAALDASGVNPWEWPKALSETVCVSSYGACEWFERCRWGK